MIDPDVRPATAADADQLSLLESEARAHLRDQRGGARWLDTHPPREGEWAGVVAAASVSVAHIGDVLVGYIVVVDVDRVATVDDVYVTPMARELGFGDALLDLALNEAKRRGCDLFEGSSLPGDRETKNLYERAGIKARLITVSTPI